MAPHTPHMLGSAPARPWRSSTLALVVALMAAPAVAQQPAPEEVIRMPEVRVSAPARLPDAPLPLDHVPGSVQILTGDEARASGARSVQDVLDRLPGVTSPDQQGNSAQRDVSLRGFQASPVTGVPQGLSVFVDGVRVNEPTVEEVNFDLIPLDDIERIEVIRGPAALFGRNTLGGALNIVTRRGGEIREVEPEVEAGSFGGQKYRLRAAGPAGPLDYYVAGTYRQEDGWRDLSRVRLGRLFAKLGLRAGDTDATLSFQRAENRIEEPGSLPLSELGRDRRLNYTGGDFFKPLLNLVTLNVHQLLAERTSLGLTAFARTLDTEQFNVNLVGANTRSFGHTASAGTTLQLDHDARVLGRADHLTLGLEYLHSDVGVSAFLEQPAGDHALDSRARDDQHGWALFAQNTLDLARDLLAPGDVLVLTTAARFDWLRHQIGDASPAGGGPSSDGTSTFSRLDPRLGLNYNVSPAAGVYAVYAQGFRAPAFLELTCARPGAICPGLQAGVAADPPLKAVTADHWEVGARLAPRSWLNLELAAFRTELHDDIFSVSPTGTIGLFFQNVGATRRQGFEADARATLDRRWDLHLGYAYTEATFRDDVELATPRLTAGCAAAPCVQHVRRGSDIPLVPRHRLDAGVDHHLTSWLTLWVSGAYVGRQRLRGDEENVARQLAPYVTLSAGARARWRGLTAFLTIRNLLDDAHETYGTFAPNAKRPGAPIEPFLTPAPPIHVDAGVAYRF
jgi:iron complex outermembrane receptor protein